MKQRSFFLKYKYEFLALVSIIPMLIGFTISTRSKHLLNEYPSEGRAEIYEVFLAARRQPNIRYRYKVQQVYYKGVAGYSTTKDIINIGDSCAIRYSLKDPAISRALRNEDKTLKIIANSKIK